jgi:hypothetical protein
MGFPVLRRLICGRGGARRSNDPTLARPGGLAKVGHPFSCCSVKFLDRSVGLDGVGAVVFAEFVFVVGEGSGDAHAYAAQVVLGRADVHMAG